MKKLLLLFAICIFISCKNESTETPIETSIETPVSTSETTTPIVVTPEVAKPIQHEEPSSSSYTNSDTDANPCIISEDFIKQDLRHPSTASFSSLDCSTDKNSDGTYTILRKVSAKNSFGIESSFIYKLRLGFKGGNWVDMNNWTLINLQSEEVR